MELTDRELAVRWWNRISTIEKNEALVNVSLVIVDINKISTLEIEYVWRNQPYNI